ncbi:hypothetical protein PV797_00955 [Clostridiaceae bacterium M8S5]|nr:hypothetical protein PV797_00955 [Clostridiaceae bacterium M8S5]
MLAAIPSNINASSGHLYFISSSMLNSFDGFIHEGLIDNTLYIYIYEGDYSVIVSFASGNENIVWSSANFIKTGSLNQISSDLEMLEWLKKYAFITDCKVEKIEQIR